jgi:hypothetical protein
VRILGAKSLQKNRWFWTSSHHQVVELTFEGRRKGRQSSRTVGTFNRHYFANVPMVPVVPVSTSPLRWWWTPQMMCKG